MVGDGFINTLKEEFKNLLKIIGKIADGDIPKWFLTKGYSPQGTFGNVWRHFLVFTTREVLLAFSG